MTETPKEQKPDNPFQALDLDAKLLRVIEQEGFEAPTPVQEHTLPAALKGSDLLVTAETGSGKTLAFVLPMLQKLLNQDQLSPGTRALILTPTRELCQQTEKTIKKYARFTAFNTAMLTGGQEQRYQRALLRRDPEIVVATPGRLKEHLHKGALDLSDLDLLILDEADRMLDMGFDEDVQDIIAQCNKERQTLLFSATLNPQTVTKAFPGLLSEPDVIKLASERQSADSITHKIILSDDAKHKNLVLEKLLQQHTGKAIVFCNTKAQATSLAGWLRYKNIENALLHGDIDQDGRNQQVQRFKSGRAQVLIATDVASRGIDIAGLDLVVNYDLPRNIEEFIHRTGRTGRSGREGLAISLITPPDWDRKARFERLLGIRFSTEVIAGVEAKFKGPEKLKASGKRASTEKRKTESKTDKPKKPKKRLRDQRNKGKRRAPSAAPEQATKNPWGDGFGAAPIKKAKPKD